MQKKEKFLNKISLVDKEKILVAMKCIVANDLKFLDLKKLVGEENIYRVRVGKFRIIFAKYADRNEVIEIKKRDENTY